MKSLISTLLLIVSTQAFAESPATTPLREYSSQVTPSAVYPVGTDQLPLPPWQQVSRYSCGLGVKQEPYMVSIDSNFIIHGELTASTYCSAGGRGGHSIHYNYTYSIEWDYCGNFKLLPYDGGALDQSAVVTDSFGNTAYVTVPNPNFNADAWLHLNLAPAAPVCLQ